MYSPVVVGRCVGKKLKDVFMRGMTLDASVQSIDLPRISTVSNRGLGNKGSVISTDGGVLQAPSSHNDSALTHLPPYTNSLVSRKLSH